MIEVIGITKIYGKKQQTFTALKEVTFNVPSGSSVAIVGKSGSGKSTLMHVISGLDRPNKGQVIIDGQDILALKQKQIDEFRSNSMGFIFQAFFVQANESCFYNVSLPLEVANVPKGRRKQMIRSALTQVELLDKAHQEARTLSGGQKQRLAIARAIVNQPKVLFADEPTGNLDSITSEVIENLLFELNRTQKVTLIIVTHDDELAAKCDMQVYMKDGMVERTESKPSLSAGIKNI